MATTLSIVSIKTDIVSECDDQCIIATLNDGSTITLDEYDKIKMDNKIYMIGYIMDDIVPLY